MIADIALHYILDMSGAASFACLLRMCDNPFHDHGKVFNWIAKHRWLTQSVIALIVAYFTVRLIG